MAERAEVHLLTSSQEWLDAIDREHETSGSTGVGKIPRGDAAPLRLVGRSGCSGGRCFLNEGATDTSAVERSSEPAVGEGWPPRQMAWTQVIIVAAWHQRTMLNCSARTPPAAVIALQLLELLPNYLPTCRALETTSAPSCERAAHAAPALQLVNLAAPPSSSSQLFKRSRSSNPSLRRSRSTSPRYSRDTQPLPQS